MSVNLEAEAERLAAMCSSGDTRSCPRPDLGQLCPNVYCDDVEPEHWLEILKKEAESVTELKARVRELERQRDYLAFELSTDDDQADCNHTHLSCEHRKGWLCKAGLKGQMQCWISEAEKAAKEAENGQRKD